MKLKHDALRDYLVERTIPIFEQRFNDGLFKHLSDEPVWRGGDTDAERREIYAIRGGSDLSGKSIGINRDVLPRWQYPELYAYKDEMYRLEKSMEERQIAEASEGAKSPR